jgi:toxin ParE1/3/4
MPNAGAGKPFRLRSAALHDLEAIWDYSARTWSPTQADIYIRKLFAAFERIAAAPEIARERVEYAPPVRIYPIESLIVVYVASSDGVDVIRVRHRKEDWTSDPIDDSGA